MIAIVGEIGSRVQVGAASMPRDPGIEMDSDAFLEALRDGSPVAERAFRDLVLRLRAPLLRFIGRWLREPEAVEEVLQETFLAVHHNLPAFAGPTRLTPWVYSLARRKVEEWLSERYACAPGEEAGAATDWEAPAPDPAPDEAAHQSQLIDWIRAAADALPEHYRAVWELCDLERRSGEEAAAALGITPTLARVRLHRARGLIVDRLRKERPGLFRKALTEGDRLRALRAPTGRFPRPRRSPFRR